MTLFLSDESWVVRELNVGEWCPTHQHKTIKKKCKTSSRGKLLAALLNPTVPTDKSRHGWINKEWISP